MKNILIHGLGQTPSSWERTIAAMTNQEDCLCLDLTQLLHGKEAIYANLYKVFSAYCAELQKPVNLCGLSLGGVLALQYTIKNPEKVNSLVLIGTQYVMPKRLLKFQNMVFHVMPEKAFEETRFGKKEFISLSKSMMDLDFSEALQKIECPVLLVCGKKDYANKRAAIEMRQQIPRAKLKLIESAGHEVNVDAPEKLGKLLDGFWKNVND